MIIIPSAILLLWIFVVLLEVTDILSGYNSFTEETNWKWVNIWPACKLILVNVLGMIFMLLMVLWMMVF